MSGRENNCSLLLRRLRADALTPFVHPAHTVLEHARQDYSTLAELRARRKIALAPSADVPAEIEVAESFTQLRDIDLIICDHVLEYMAEPRERVSQLKEILKPGGRLIAVALYDEAFWRPNLQEKAEHFYSWNVQTLGNLLIDCGYEFESRLLKRWPKRDRLVHWAAKFGPSTALMLSRLFRPEFEVRIVAKRPTA